MTDSLAQMAEPGWQRTVGGVLRDRAKDDPDAPLIRCGGDWQSTSHIDAAADALAGGLARLGIGKGDRVACISPNRLEIVQLLFACARLGAILVPLNAFFKGEFLRYQLTDARPTVLVADAAGVAAAAEFLADAQIATVVCLEDLAGTEVPAGVATVSFSGLAAGDPAPSVEVLPTDILSIMYTSGTTGMPKGCMLSHSYYTSGPRLFVANGWVEPGDRLITALPLFHAAAHLVPLMNGLCGGGAVSFEQQFSASRFMDSVREIGATSIWGTGSMAATILAQPPRADDRVDGVRLAHFTPLRPDLQEAFEERFAIPVTVECFGQSECLPIAISPFDAPRRRATAGRAVSALGVTIVGNDDRAVPTGTAGEIVLRPQEPGMMFSGYWNRPEETLAAFRNLWFHTGDFGILDEDGYLRFMDRKKDAIRRRGENVSSFELETAIVQHPAVSQVAAFGVPSDLSEDEIVAMLVLADGSQRPEAADLFGFFSANLPYFAIPRYVAYVAELPTNTQGKVVKAQLRAAGVPGGAVDFDELGLSVQRSQRRG